MELSAYLHGYADKNVPHKQQAIIKAFAKALEVIPRQLCDNAGLDATDILNRLRLEHRKGNKWAGVDFSTEGVSDNLARFVWEPALVKVNAIQAAVEASCLILSVDETISKCDARGAVNGEVVKCEVVNGGRGMCVCACVVSPGPVAVLGVNPWNER